MHRIDAHHMAALQVGNHGGVIDGLERLLGAVTTFHLRELADTGHELVRAGRGIPWLARLLADEARRVEVWSTAKELTEQLDFALWRVGGEPRRWEGSQWSRWRFVRCELLSKRGNSGFRRGTLRFDPVEVRLCLGELGDERVARRGRRDIRKLFFGGRFHGVGGNTIPRVAASSTVLPDTWIAA